MSGDCAGWEDPFGLLACYVGDEVEVVVVVEHDESGSFGRSGDEQVCDLDSSVLTEFGEVVLDARGSMQYLLVHRNEGPCVSLLPNRLVVARAGGRVAGFEVRDGAASDESSLEERIQSLGHLGPRPAGQRGGVA